MPRAVVLLQAMKHVVLWAADSEADLFSEARRSLPEARLTRHPSALLEAELPGAAHRALPQMAFARQWLAGAVPVLAGSIREWAEAVAGDVRSGLPEDRPWLLDVQPHYGEAPAHRIGARAWHTLRKSGSVPPREQPRGVAPDPEAGRRRCELIRQAVIEVLKKSRRHLLRNLRPHPLPFTPEDSLAQVLLTSPGEGFISVRPTPLPSQLWHLVSPFPCGIVEVPPDRDAPSRAFAKLVESGLRLGDQIEPGQICVDLGAAPGSWTYAAARRGARVTAVDRSPLRSDLMESRNVRFTPGDAFTFRPDKPVDWLLCDVIAEPERSVRLLLDWARAGWCRRFVVTLKLREGDAIETLEVLKREMPACSERWCVKKLTSNKKEVCVFGVVA
jgi:23S rRNA (cytidine2498-2'-O)-methyltransferase